MRKVLVVASVAALVGTAVPVFAKSAPATLKFGRNTFAYSHDYGEPGLATVGHTVYVTTPGQGGAVLAKSTDDGKHWTELKTVVPPSTSPGSQTSGGDSDVAVGKDGT
ncbi:MAG: hypothetical protein QOC82_508, partial [Frankiaceae bacterium]|nr:hypothetical protein [Frankiaceae bacterium]